MRKPSRVFISVLSALVVSSTSCVRSTVVISPLSKVVLINGHVLISKQKHIKYIIDSAETYIAATDTLGNELWKKDPWLDYKIWTSFFPRTKREAEQLKHNREPINIFYLDTLDHNGYRDSYGLKEGDEIVRIGYGTMFGFIDARNGEFHYQGQD